MRQGLVSLLLGFGLTLLTWGAVSAYSPEEAETPRRLPLHDRSLPIDPAISLPYAQIINGAAPVYSTPSDALSGRPPTGSFSPGFVFTGLATISVLLYGSEKWYELRKGGFVAANHVLVYPPSNFHGVHLDRQPEIPFGWVLADTPVSGSPGAEPLKGAPHYARYALVALLDRQISDGAVWNRVADGEWISQFKLGVISISARPAGVGPNEKWIEVNLYEQTLSAYEGDRLVYATLLSSGLPWWPTRPGLFRVYDKVRLGMMTGAEGRSDYYFIEDIPWIMYFDNDIALHAAYWHDGFGSPHSHGCVNLAPADAKWLFDWTTPGASSDNHTFSSARNPGTWVWVHD